MDTKDTNDFLMEEVSLNEKTVVSFHKRPVDKLVAAHKEQMQAKKHEIIQHKTYKDGSHEILHRTPSKNLRVTTITQAQKRGAVTKMTNRPASPSIRQKMAFKK